MQVEHADPDLAALEVDESLDAKWPKGIGKKYRWVMQQIRLAAQKKQLYQIGSLRLLKLQGRENEERMWLNDKYRLEMTFTGEAPDERATILRISNHYDQ